MHLYYHQQQVGLLSSIAVSPFLNMADTASPPKPTSLPEGVKYEPPKPPPKQNPVFRMMGMPNFRFRLPSRNWMIFLSIVGGWTGAVMYDKREKRKIQKKWCDLVAHVAHQPLPVNQMPRKLTVFISAPPGDGIRPSRQYFKDYVKPILVAAAMDYDVIEGRKEGDVRYGTAEQIRRVRRKKGEGSPVVDGDEQDTEVLIESIREKMYITPEPAPRGDLVLGRHTWKEYVRGLHEGWLGPIDEPTPPPSETVPFAQVETSPLQPTTESQTGTPASVTESPDTPTPTPEEKKEEEEKKKPYPPPSYLLPTSYPSSNLSTHTPFILEPSEPIHQQHILGFLKTPIRIYHFLTRRHLADQIGRQTAAIVLAASRPYEQGSSFSSFTDGTTDLDPVATRAPELDASSRPSSAPLSSSQWEQQSVLDQEEVYWHKSIRKPRKEDDSSEPILTSDVVIDERIGSRMRRFALDPEQEARAGRLLRGEEKPDIPETIDLRSEKVVVGNLDDD
jgi:mitochondrial import inner membrane translocase subunit TIM54